MEIKLAHLSTMCKMPQLNGRERVVMIASSEISLRSRLLFARHIALYFFPKPLRLGMLLIASWGHVSRCLWDIGHLIISQHRQPSIVLNDKSSTEWCKFANLFPCGTASWGKQAPCVTKCKTERNRNRAKDARLLNWNAVSI